MASMTPSGFRNEYGKDSRRRLGPSGLLNLLLTDSGGSKMVMAAITSTIPSTSDAPNSSPKARTPQIVETMRLDVIMMETAAGSTLLTA